MIAMNRKQIVPSAQRAVIPAPPSAAMVRANGSARRRAAPEAEADSSRAERIREVAYQLYEARGHVDGHDLDDWLAAEAAVNGRAG